MLSSDRHVNLGCVYATALWIVTALFIFAGSAVAIDCPAGRGLAVGGALLAHGLACSAGAATVTIRAMLNGQSRLIQDAFDLGREAGPVRRVR